MHVGYNLAHLFNYRRGSLLTPNPQKPSPNSHAPTPNSRRGFTIVELLIVIVVIGILAGIVIIAYNGIQQNARVASLQADLDNASRKLKLYQVDNASYPVGIDCSASPVINTICLKPSGSTIFTAFTPNNSTTPQTFCLTATNGTTNYYVNQDSTPVSGACNVTNLAANPSAATNITGWSIAAAGTTGTIANVSTGGPSGIVSSFFRRAATSTATASPISISSVGTGTAATPVTENTTYTLSAYFRSSCDLGGGFRIDVAQFNSSGGSVSTSSGILATDNVNTWQRLTRTYTSDPGVSYIQARYAFSGPTTCPAISNFDLTGLMITVGSIVYNYADGNTTNWVWNGPVDSSSSTGPPV